MNHGKTRLELTWIGKENRPRLEPRILIEDQEKSYHAKLKRSDQPSAISDRRWEIKPLSGPENTDDAFCVYELI